MKIIQWIVLNIASICGVLQALIKCLKEIVTAVLNLLAALVILLPGVSLEKANQITIGVRAMIEKLDVYVQTVTNAILKFSLKG